MGGYTFTEMSADAASHRLHELESRDPDNFDDVSNSELADYYEELLSSSNVCLTTGCTRVSETNSRWCAVCEIEYLHLLKEMEAKGHVIVDPATKASELWQSA